MWTRGAALVAAAVMAAGPESGAAERERRVEVVRFGASGYLGVDIADVGADDVSRLKLAGERGALVREVVEDSPAAKAGLKADDVILGYQGESVHSAAQLSRLVRETPVGRAVTIEVSRAGTSQRLQARIEEARGRRLLGDLDFVAPAPPVPPAPPAAPLLWDHEGFADSIVRRVLRAHPRRLGIAYQELTDQLAEYFKVPGGGLLVTRVEADSPAARAGLKAGDVIVKVDGKRTDDGRDLVERIREAPEGAGITLGVQRDGRPLDLEVKLAGERGRARRTPTT